MRGIALILFFFVFSLRHCFHYFYVSGCDVNRVNSSNKLPLYSAIENRAANDVSDNIMLYQ